MARRRKRKREPGDEGSPFFAAGTWWKVVDPNAPAAAPGDPSGPLAPEVLGHDRYTIVDPEGFETVHAVHEVVVDLLALAGRDLQGATAECSESATGYVLTLRHRQAEHTHRLARAGDWLDLAALLACLNAALAGCRSARRFVRVSEPCFGQEVGVALVTPAERDALREAGLALDEDW